MTQIFDSVLRASLSGSVIILVVLILRTVLKGTPKKYLCLLWMLAVLRLLVPFSVESPLSLQPDPDRISSALQPEHSTVQEALPPVSEIPGTPAVTLPAADTAPGQIQAPSYEAPDVTVRDDALSQPDIVNIDTFAMAATVWAAVVSGFLVYTAASYFLLKRKVRDAVQVDECIFESNAIGTPFLLGYLKPCIYLPAGLPLQDVDHILAHERCHIRRLDNWTKLLGFLCVSVHWFNPLVWAAYALLCRDIEMACDEAVVAGMPAADRKAYSGALLRCAAGQRQISACPVAFGEVSVKQRIPKILTYRKPAFWIVLAAVIAIVFVAVCFLTSPPMDEAALLEQCRTALQEFHSTQCYHSLYSSNGHSMRWRILDSPEEYEDQIGSSREYLLIMDSTEGSMHRLYLDGQYLQRDISFSEDGEVTDSGWYSTDWSGSSSFSAGTVADLKWDAFDSITVTDCRKARMIRSPETQEHIYATIVTLHMKTEDRDFDREFYLDEEGTLFRIDDTWLLSNDRNEIINDITQHIQGTSAETIIYLDRCVQALDALRQAETLYISTYSKILSVPGHYWIRSGDNAFVTRYEDGVFTMLLDYNGSHFRRDKTYHGIYIIGDTKWCPAESGITGNDYPWFLNLDWDSSGALVLNRYMIETSEYIEVWFPQRECLLEFIFDLETGMLTRLYSDSMTYRIEYTDDVSGHLELHYRYATGLEGDPAPAVQKIRETMEFLQNGSYTTVLAERSGQDSYVRLSSFQVGEDLLIQYPGTGQSYLRLDGKDYIQNGNGWEETELGDLSGLEYWWISDLKWDPDRFYVQDAYSSTYYVTVVDASMPQGFYLLKFSYDTETGALSSLTRINDVDSPNQSDHATIVTIRHPDPEDTEAYIRRCFDDAGE